MAKVVQRGMESAGMLKLANGESIKLTDFLLEGDSDPDTAKTEAKNDDGTLQFSEETVQVMVDDTPTDKTILKFNGKAIAHESTYYDSSDNASPRIYKYHETTNSWVGQ